MNHFKNVQLDKLSIKLGANSGTKKSIKLFNLNEQINTLSQLHAKFIERGELNVLTMDSGVVNFAYINTTINKDWSLKINHWNKLQLEKIFNGGVKATLQPRVFTHLIQQLNKFIDGGDDLSEKPDVYILERQRIRTQSSKFVTDPIIKINFLEQLIYYSWTSQGKTILSSDPIKLCQLYPNEKKERIRLVKDLIKGTAHDPVERLYFKKQFLTKEMSDYLANTSRFKIFDFLQLDEDVAGPNKDDDLADCLLHTLAWRTWLYHFHKLQANNFDFPSLLEE